MELIAVVILACYGVLLSYLSVRDFAPLESVPCSLLAFGGTLGLMVWATKLCLAARYPWLFAFLLVGVATGLTHSYFLATLFGGLVAGTIRGFGGDGNLKVRPTYDKAEAAVKTGDLELAVTLYAEGAQTHPHDPTPHLRLADIAAQLSQWEPAVEHMKHAIDIAKEPGERSAAVFRLADLLNAKMRRPEAARQTLQQFIDRYPDSKEAEFARQRLDNIGGA